MSTKNSSQSKINELICGYLKQKIELKKINTKQLLKEIPLSQINQ